MFTAPVRGRKDTEKWGVRGALVAVAALVMASAFATPAHAAKAYTFTKVVDSAADGFNPQTLRLSCPSINNGGDIAFKSERGGVDGIFRANADGTPLTTIFQVPLGGGDLLANGNPSMNNLGEVSFGASSDGVQSILRGDGTTVTTIASNGFASFGDSTSINDAGEVAFDGQLDSGERGLFSGTGGPATTHYLDTQEVSVDGSPASFNATDDRPSINAGGDIAFLDQTQDASDQEIFRGREGVFTTISTSDSRPVDSPPVLNDVGTAAWQTFFFDETGSFASAIVTGNGDGTTTRVADSAGAFDIFDSYAINNSGTVAFSATLDSDTLGVPSIFVGPSPKKDRVIGPGDRLDGGTVVGLNFCEEGLNDSGQLAFVAEIEDRNGDVRVGVFRATPRR